MVKDCIVFLIQMVVVVFFHARFLSSLQGVLNHGLLHVQILAKSHKALFGQFLATLFNLLETFFHGVLDSIDADSSFSVLPV